MNLIIGASSGLGKSLAADFSKFDKTLLVSRRKIKVKSKNIKSIQLDIVTGNITKIFSKIKKKTISNIIFTVGLTDWNNDNIKINPKRARLILDTNFYSISKLVYKLLEKKKLKDDCLICFCSSVTTILPRHRQIMYCAAKSALNSFSKSINFFIKINKLKYRVVNMILGYMETDMNKSIQTPLSKINPKIVSKYIYLNRDKLEGQVFFPKYWIFFKILINLIPEKMLLLIFNLFFFSKKYF
jgi:short-subunit dehydrogenase